MPGHLLHLPAWDDRRFDLMPDLGLLNELSAQMAAADESGKPAECWRLTDEEANVPLAAYLDALNGEPGSVLLKDTLGPETLSGDALLNMRYAKWRLLPYYEDFVRKTDSQGLFDGITLEDLAARNWRMLDLESLMDFQHLSAVCDLSQEHLTILEVGSGFGRLPEFLMKVLGRKIRYINIDAVPASMMWFDGYMRRAFPDLKVGTVTGPGPIDLAAQDVLTIPAWRLDQVSFQDIDIGINIESLQEMSQPLVDFYISLFDRSVRVGGTIMLINSREHLFLGTWDFPRQWRCRFRHRSPKAWTDDYRIELFEKTARDCSAENALHEVIYQRELALTRTDRAAVEATGKLFNPHAIPGL